MDDVEELLTDFELRPPASKESVEELQKELGRPLPKDYREFLLKSNGGEGSVGELGYLQLIPLEKVMEVNLGYSVGKWAPELLIVATNLGGTAYALGKEGVEPGFFEVELIDLSVEAAVFVGKSLAALLRHVGKSQ